MRACETPNRPGLFRLTDHIERLKRSARILDMPLRYSVAEIVAASKDVVRKRIGGLLPAPAGLLRLWRNGAGYRSLQGGHGDHGLGLAFGARGSRCLTRAEAEDFQLAAA